MTDWLKPAREAVQAASAVCSEIQRQLISADTLTKKDRSPVTIADFASQAIICKALREADPGIAIVGEEDAAELRLPENAALLDKIQQFLPGWQKNEILEAIDAGNSSGGEFFFTLDPIDGTKGFLRGEQYAVALALIVEGTVEMGLLGCPNLPFPGMANGGSLYFAQSGRGSFVTALSSDAPQRLCVSPNADDDPVRFLESVESGHGDLALQERIRSVFGDRARIVRHDSQVKYAIVAGGGAEVYLRLPNPEKPDYREKIWDHAAGCLIVQEAGGRITDMTGQELNFGLGKTLAANRGLLVSNGYFHPSVLKLIGDHA